MLDLLDDMNTWGQRKQVPGEVDTFELDSTHELYGHMNINYLQLDRKPTIDDWSPVLGALRRGDFFTTTGEVLIHSFEAKDGKVKATGISAQPALLVSWDGREVKRRGGSRCEGIRAPKVRAPRRAQGAAGSLGCSRNGRLHATALAPIRVG